jgi:hypothetical protein
MRPLLAALLLAAAAAGTARAADEPKANTLTAREIADGWILLFDGQTTFGWRPSSSESDVKPDVAVRDGTLILSGYQTSLFCTSWFRYFEISFEYRTAGVRQDEPSTDADFNVHTPSDGKRPGLSIGSGFGDPRSKDWGRMRVTFAPDGWSLSRQDNPTEKPRDSKQELGKQYGVSELRFSTPHLKDSRLTLRNVKLRPLGGQPLFNGKDLTGWKKYEGDDKRNKTEFSVTKEGWLHLKNGPGDLQTEGRYDDFVLQAECRTNGKNLNSGVFFRCIPGEYQNGYEAQIHNGFDAEHPKEYVVEEYDPKTNEPKDKKKVTSPALDYGTGAIYRRVPARSQAAKDGEWFTMTVVARGRHIATWVNGVQQVDWTDNRPLKDNPRNGCRLEKGPVSLQGHDATTDIDFRNLRLAELPRPAK